MFQREADRSVAHKFFLFAMLNVFLGVTISGMLINDWDAITSGELSFSEVRGHRPPPLSSTPRPAARGGTRTGAERGDDAVARGGQHGHEPGGSTHGCGDVKGESVLRGSAVNPGGGRTRRSHRARPGG